MRPATCERLVRVTFSDSDKTSGHRMRGVRRVLRWLESFEGDSWQERWVASGSDALERAWADRVADCRRRLKSGSGSLSVPGPRRVTETAIMNGLVR